MQKLIFILKVAVILTVILSGCTTSHLHYSGTYRITYLEGDTSTFRNVQGKYLIPAKGLKNGSKIRLMRTGNKAKANVIRIK